jgi:mannose/cellobiose epimerase-like protein (N-acyl-D-glucosamine 2-epimerase family)
MVTLGAIVDILKCLSVSSYRFSQRTVDELILKGQKILEYILKYHYDPQDGKFWEENTEDEKPFVNDKGHWICDPGHTAEFCGFAAEFCDITKRKNIVPELIKILSWVNDNAYSQAGVMYKNIDIFTMSGVSDRTENNGREYKTAPWWNLRECSAAAIKLYQLSGNEKCLHIYKKSQNATYLNYPNQNTGGLMVQTLDADTLEPLPFYPATGNLDPMHSPRAREREIEALKSLKNT